MKLNPVPLCIALFLMGCDSASDIERSMPTRPVTVLELSERDFAREQELTGAVSLYREEQIGFEIDGRVTMVLDEGLEVRGPAFNEKSEVVRRGDPIAAMEGTRYDSQVGALQAQVDAANRSLQATKAQAKLTRQTLERKKNILAKGVLSQQSVDDAQSAFDQANAMVEARRAAVRAANQQLTRATEDLGDAVIYAPFSGRITKAHISEGAVVAAGTPIVTLTLMDPVQVEVEVSADVEREIETGDRVVVYPKDPFKPDSRVAVNAIVYEKSAVADPLLRTFRIVLMLRNERIHVYQRSPELQGLPVANEYLPVVREFQGEEGPLFVPVDALLEDDGQMYVLRLPGVSFNDSAARSAVGKHVPERINVTLGDDYTTVVKWNFRSMSSDVDLAEGDFLIMNPLVEYETGVVIGRPKWLLRPRDLVPVRFNLTQSERGFYVPNHAIVMLAGSAHVYRVNDEGVAHATPVTLLDSVGSNRQVESELLVAGTQIVVDGVHYISDGQQVTVTDIVK
ncbi:MAG: efflux RND transporter periplasmic adaptor subunit [Amphritea sp.]